MDCKDYEKHVLGEWCWICHVATHWSSAKQRQCPGCRHKWSYQRRQQQWRLLVSFCEGMTAYQAAKCVPAAYRTAYTSFQHFRQAVVRLDQEDRHRLCKEIERYESFAKAKRKGCHKTIRKTIILGLLEHAGCVYSVLVPQISPSSKSPIKASSVKGSVFYIDEEKNDKGRTHGNVLEDFLSYVKQQYLKRHGMRYQNFPLYLHEYEFRFNHRRDHLLDLLFPHCISSDILMPTQKIDSDSEKHQFAKQFEYCPRN